jgi:hypothetical protein
VLNVLKSYVGSRPPSPRLRRLKEVGSRKLKENKKMMKFKFEGAIGQSNPEFKKFIGFAIRSLAEVVTCLHKASKRNYISEKEFREHYEYAFNLMNMMVAFKEKIK